MPTIEVIISPTGETQVQTKGFVGSDCQPASKFLEAALGQRTGEQLTAEYYMPAHHPQRIQEGS